eukprot:1365404-Amorphochlora_amoeboformis.AAC.1
MRIPGYSWGSPRSKRSQPPSDRSSNTKFSVGRAATVIHVFILSAVRNVCDSETPSTHWVPPSQKQGGEGIFETTLVALLRVCFVVKWLITVEFWQVGGSVRAVTLVWHAAKRWGKRAGV